MFIWDRAQAKCPTDLVDQGFRAKRLRLTIKDTPANAGCEIPFLMLLAYLCPAIMASWQTGKESALTLKSELLVFPRPIEPELARWMELELSNRFRHAIFAEESADHGLSVAIARFHLLDLSFLKSLSSTNRTGTANASGDGFPAFRSTDKSASAQLHNPKSQSQA